MEEGRHQLKQDLEKKSQTEFRFMFNLERNNHKYIFQVSAFAIMFLWLN